MIRYFFIVLITLIAQTSSATTECEQRIVDPKAERVAEQFKELTSDPLIAFLYSPELDDPFSVQTAELIATGEEVVVYSLAGKHASLLDPDTIVINGEGEASRVKDVHFSRQAVRMPEPGSHEMKFQIDLNADDLGIKLPQNTGDFSEAVNESLKHLFTMAKVMLEQPEKLFSRATLQAAVGGHLAETVKIDLLSMLRVQMVSAAIGQDDVLRMNHLEEALDPIQVIQYFRSDVIERLQKVYKGYGLPDEVIFQLDLQEAALADHRKIEILVLHKGRIAVYSRIYLGNKVMPYEQRHFGDRTPVVSLIRSAMYMGSVPNHLMPAERTMKPDGDGQTIFDRYRDDPEFSGCLFIEKGRTYTNPDLTSSELDEAKRLYFTILYSVYRKLAPNGDLSKIIQFANTGPAGRRHYRATYGFDDIPGGVLESGDFDPRFRFDIGVRVGDEIDKEKKEQENPRKIYLLVSTAEQFIDSPEVRKYLKRAVGKNTFLQIDPRFTYPGSFELGDGIVKTDLVNKVKRTKSF